MVAGYLADNMSLNQPDLFDRPNSLEPGIQADQDHLRAHLAVTGWQTRSQLCQHFGWTERHLRDVAESMGTDIVRGQLGFKLTASVTRDDISAGIQSAEAFLSQGKRMIRYGLGLKRRLHSVVG